MIEYRGGADRDTPFRLAVKELVIRRVLEAHPVKGGWFSGPPVRYVVVDGPLIDADVAPVLGPVRTAYRDARRRPMKARSGGAAITGVAMHDLVETGHRQLGGVGSYLDLHVGPALVERGLLERSRSPGGAVRPGFDWTAAGREADVLLHEWLDLARRNVVGMATSDMRTAVEFVAGAGCALLLLDDHQAALACLGERLRAGAGRTGVPVEWEPPSGDGAVRNRRGAALELDLSCIADFFPLAGRFGIMGPNGG